MTDPGSLVGGAGSRDSLPCSGWLILMNICYVDSDILHYSRSYCATLRSDTDKGALNPLQRHENSRIREFEKLRKNAYTKMLDVLGDYYAENGSLVSVECEFKN